MSRMKARMCVLQIRNDYGITPVTTGAFVQLVASLGNDLAELEIFDSSGSTLQFAYGPAGGEVNAFQIMPGGNNPNKVSQLLNKGMRLAVKAIDVNAASGELLINGYV